MTFGVGFCAVWVCITRIDFGSGLVWRRIWRYYPRFFRATTTSCARCASNAGRGSGVLALAFSLAAAVADPSRVVGPRGLRAGRRVAAFFLLFMFAVLPLCLLCDVAVQ